MFTVGIDYLNDARWCADGKYYSCSNTMAAIDMTLGLISDMVDVSLAENIARETGYHWDPESKSDFVI